MPLLHMHNHTEFDCSTSNYDGISRGSPKPVCARAQPPWDVGHDWRLRTCPFSISVTTPNLVVLRQKQGVPQTLEHIGTLPLKMGCAWSLTNMPLPTWVSIPYLITVGQMVRAYIWKFVSVTSCNFPITTP